MAAKKRKVNGNARPRMHDDAMLALSYGFARRFVHPRSKVLDVSAEPGRLAEVLRVRLGHTPTEYHVRKAKGLPGGTWIKPFTKNPPKGSYDVIIALGPDRTTAELKFYRAMLADGGTLLVEHGGRDAVLTKAGLHIEYMFGTDAPLEELKQQAMHNVRGVMRDLLKFYDDDLVAMFLSPLHPECSTRSIYVLHDKDRRPKVVEERDEIKGGGKCTTCKQEKRHAKDCPHRPGWWAGAEAAKKAKATARKINAKVAGKRAVEGRPQPRRGSGLFIREHLLKGTPPPMILELVHKEFPGSKAKMGDVNWNRRKLVQAGERPKS